MRVKHKNPFTLGQQVWHKTDRRLGRVMALRDYLPLCVKVQWEERVESGQKLVSWERIEAVEPYTWQPLAHLKVGAIQQSTMPAQIVVIAPKKGTAR